MAAKSFTCDKQRCFANINGRCEILTSRTTKQPCPFFKTSEEFEIGKLKANARNYKGMKL